MLTPKASQNIGSAVWVLEMQSALVAVFGVAPVVRSGLKVKRETVMPVIGAHSGQALRLKVRVHRGNLAPSSPVFKKSLSSSG